MSEAAMPGLSSLLTDDRLTSRAVRGDERAFAAIFRRYHQSLYRFCLAIVGNPEDAQDALQNTMIKVLRALPDEDRKIELKPWLYRIAHNESIDLLRRRRDTRQLDVEQIAPGYGLAEEAATRERLRRLLADMGELPERQREVLVMRELSGLEFEEIGAALGTSGAVARQTLYEARQSLRQMEEGREMSCTAVTEALSDGDGRVTRRRGVRAHLRSCESCRAFRDEIKSRQSDLAALSPLPAVAAAGMLHGLLGGSQGAAGGGGLAATLGGGAAKTIGASAAAKGVATAAVVAAVGVTAADQTGAIHLGLPGEQKAKPSAPAKLAPGTHSSAAGQAANGADNPAASHNNLSGARGAETEAVAGGGKGAAKQQVPVTSAPGATGAEHHAVPADGNGSTQATGHENAGAKGQDPPAGQVQSQGQKEEVPAATGGKGTPGGQYSPQEPSGGSEAAPAHPPSPPRSPEPPVQTPAPSSPAPPEEAPANPPTAAPNLQAPVSSPGPEKGPPPGTPSGGKSGEKRP